MAGDSRKAFILATTGNYFGLQTTDDALKKSDNSSALNNFLDDGNVSVLAGKHPDKRIVFENKVPKNSRYDIYYLLLSK